MRKNRSVWAIAIVVVLSFLQTARAMAADDACGKDEYALMSLLIREQYGPEFSLILIADETESSYPAEPLGYLRETWPKLKRETIDSLIVRYGAAPRRLEERFDLPQEYRLMSEGEYLSALRVRSNAAEGGTLAAGADAAAAGMDAYGSIVDSIEPDWDSFDEAFPDAQGYLTFSRVAFDAGCTQALVVFSNAYRCSGVRTKWQTRDMAFFARKDGAWKLVGVSRGLRAVD